MSLLVLILLCQLLLFFAPNSAEIVFVKTGLSPEEDADGDTKTETVDVKKVVHMRVNVNVYNHHHTYPINPFEQLLMMTQNSQHNSEQDEVRSLDMNEPLNLSEIQQWLKMTLFNLEQQHQQDSPDFHNLVVLIEKLFQIIDESHQDKDKAMDEGIPNQNEIASSEQQGSEDSSIKEAEVQQIHDQNEESSPNANTSLSSEEENNETNHTDYIQKSQEQQELSDKESSLNANTSLSSEMENNETKHTDDIHSNSSQEVSKKKNEDDKDAGDTIRIDIKTGDNHTVQAVQVQKLNKRDASESILEEIEKVHDAINEIIDDKTEIKSNTTTVHGSTNVEDKSNLTESIKTEHKDPEKGIVNE